MKVESVAAVVRRSWPEAYSVVVARHIGISNAGVTLMAVLDREQAVLAHFGVDDATTHARRYARSELSWIADALGELPSRPRLHATDLAASFGAQGDISVRLVPIDFRWPLIMELHDAGVFHDAVWNHTVKGLDRIEDALAGHLRPREIDVTHLYTSLTGDPEAEFCLWVCLMTGLVYRDSFRIIHGHQFNAEHRASTCGSDGRRGNKSIDIVIIDIAHPDRAAVAAVEVKFYAEVDGGHGYCVKAEKGYSDQTICYVHGCELKLDPSIVKFVWLTPRGELGRHFLSRYRGDDIALAAAFEEHVALVRHWTHVGMKGAIDAVARGVSDPRQAQMLRRALGELRLMPFPVSVASKSDEG